METEVRQAFSAAQIELPGNGGEDIVTKGGRRHGRHFTPLFGGALPHSYSSLCIGEQGHSFAEDLASSQTTW